MDGTRRMPCITKDGGSRYRLIDDHDICVWVNVYFGTGSPGCPGQSPESHKMVVVIVVVDGGETTLLCS